MRCVQAGHCLHFRF